VAKRAARDRFVVRPEEGQLTLADIDPGKTKGIRKPEAKGERSRDLARLLELQTRLYAENTRSLLLVLQGMDTSGKDGTITHVIGGINPLGVRITGFKAPTDEERKHDFLWRIRKALPQPGEIAIFNRSHYEDVLIARVKNLVPPSVWQKRYDEINRFEEQITAAGTTIVKVCLHISFDEQRKRLLSRLLTPEKRWKFNPNDLEERSRWPEYQTAYDAALFRCSTEAAPWYVVPADKKWYRNWAVTRMLIETLEEMDPRYPQRELDIAHLARQLAAPDAFADKSQPTDSAASQRPASDAPARRRRPVAARRRPAARHRRKPA